MAITGIDTIDGKQLLAAGAVSATSAAFATNAGSAQSAVSAISAGSAISAQSANIAFYGSDGSTLTNVMRTTNIGGTNNIITGYNGSAFSAGSKYEGITPIMVDNTAYKISADTAILTAQSPITIETTTSNGVEINTIKFTGNTGAVNAFVNGDTIDYSAASAMKMNVYNGGGRTAASAWGYLDSITLYPEGGSTSYGKTTFSLPDEYGFSGLLCRNGNQFKYIPYPFESAYHTSTSGLEMTGTDTKRTYFMAGPDTKFSIPVPKHTTIELHYQGMMDVGNINYDTIMGFEFTNSFSTADTGSSYIMATAEIILPTIREVANAASLGDTYNAYTSIDAPYYRRTYSTYMRYDNTSNYDQSLYMRVAPTIMGTQGWNTASWLKIGQPQPCDNIYYKLIPDLD